MTKTQNPETETRTRTWEVRGWMNKTVTVTTTARTLKDAKREAHTKGLALLPYAGRTYLTLLETDR
jgi:hypothetical protein